MYYFNNNIKYVVGRSILALTIFVPYDCYNHCPFCTSKDDYSDTSKFSLSNITKAISDLLIYRGISINIKDIVITGGEPFADLNKLQILLDACKPFKKHVYINTTLPCLSDREAKEIYQFLKKNEDFINGINISRHMCFKTVLENDKLVERIYKNLNIPIRINSVLLDVEAEYSRVSEFIDKYVKISHSINFRGDYTKIKTQDDLRGLDNPFAQVLFNMDNLSYLGSGGCQVCNNDDFITKEGVYVSFHRGYEHSLIKQGRYYIINDIIIKQDGSILIDWDGEKFDLSVALKSWSMRG